MCSNTSNCGGVGGHCDSYLKKPKRPRVPRRGPGVAELEKILRQQENNNDMERSKIQGFSSCMISPLSNSSSYNPHFSVLSSSNSLPVNVPFDLDHTGYSPPPPPPLPKTSLYGKGSSSNSNTLIGGGSCANGGNGVHIGGSVIGLPEQALLPTVWGSCESSNNGKGPEMASGFPFPVQSLNGSYQKITSPPPLPRKECQYSSPMSLNGSYQKIPSPPPLPRKDCHYSSPMINYFPQSVMSSSSTPSSAGLYHIEPPSNQRSCQHYTSLWPEEEKMVGTKRPLPFSVDNTPVPPFYPNMHKPDPTPSCGNHGAFNLELSHTVSRDAKPSGPLELSSKKCISDYGAPNGNFLIFGSPTNPSPLNQTPQREVYNLNSLPFQDSMKDTYKRPGQGGLVDKKSFYSFLVSEEQLGRAETTLSLSNERSEARGDGIDLSLKL